jgi:hypothetical protein
MDTEFENLLLRADALAGLGATRDWQVALEGEPHFRSDEPLRDIIQSPMPASFAKLEAERYGTAMAAARLSARNTLQPSQQLQTANITPSQKEP